MHVVPVNCQIILTLLLLTLNVTLSVRYNSRSLAQNLQITSFFPPQINRVAQSLRSSSLLLLKRSVALKIHRKTFIINCNFRKATSFRSKDYYPATRDIFAIAALFLLSNNETVFTSCKPIQHEVYLVVSIHWI